MTGLLRSAGPASTRSAVIFAMTAALAATAWFYDPVGDRAMATEDTPVGQSRERPARPDGFLSASPFDPARRAVEGMGSLSKPAAPVAPEAQPSSVEAAAPSLAGILVVYGDGQRMAMFDGRWHDVGSLVSGWIIAAIEPERVTLRQGERSLVLRREDAFRP